MSQSIHASKIKREQHIIREELGAPFDKCSTILFILIKALSHQNSEL